MSTIHWLSSDEQSEWDAFVTRHPLGLVYHLSSWKRVLESSFGHMRGRFLALRDGNGQIQAGLPVYTVSSWLLGNRTVVVPWATMCDPLISTNEEFNLLWPSIAETSKKHRSRRVEIRTRHIASECIPTMLKASARYKHNYLPINDPTDLLFASFDKSNICRAIAKARREGIVVEERQDEDGLRAFHAFLGATRRRHSLPQIPFSFFQAMHRSLRPDCLALFLAMHADKPVGGVLITKFKNLWTVEYSGTADDAIRGVSQLLHWEAIQRAKSCGAAYFSFGRTSLDNTGLLIHKRRWATIEEDLTDFVSPLGTTPAQGHESTKIGGMALSRTVVQHILRHTPPAVQKIFGEFCYRHLG